VSGGFGEPRVQECDSATLSINYPDAFVEAGRQEGVAILPTHRFEARRGQPQRDVGGLHRLSYHPDEIIAKCVEVDFFAQLGREGFQGLGSVVLAAVEATVDKALDAPPEGNEQCGGQECGCDDCQGGLLE
jgi:hypothetical protein